MNFKLEGLRPTVQAMETLTRATERNTMRRTLLSAGQVTASTASTLAPEDRGILSFSYTVSPRLTSRHRAEQLNRASEVEVYIGPAGGLGALNYASHTEFGTVNTPAQPHLRPAWEGTKGLVLARIVSGLKTEVLKAAARAARKAARA